MVQKAILVEISEWDDHDQKEQEMKCSKEANCNMGSIYEDSLMLTISPVVVSECRTK